jgi:DNA repair exonuclease SbcCD ATPase subunit
MKNNKKLKEMLNFQDLTEEEKKSRGILGRLYGPCASIIDPTRNGRKYSDEVWEKVFNENEIVKEMFANGGIPMELDHPTDREETCSDRIAAMLPELPKKDTDGHLICYVDLIDTPCGRIAYQLAKYGFKLGISSRGTGEVIENLNGEEEVDANSYDFKTFDLVLLPAVKDARLKLAESLQNGKTLKQALTEELNRANEDEQKIMKETLDDLNIEYTHESDDIDKKETEVAVDDVKANMVKELQDSLLAKESAEQKVVELQEKLSVCYAKEAKYEEDIEKYKSTIRNLSESASKVRALESKIKSLNEELDKKDLTLKNESEKYDSLVEKHKISANRQSRLTESISTKNQEIKELKESFENSKNEYETKIETLNEDLAEVKKNLTIKTTEYSNKLSNSNKLVEKYKDMARTAVNKYIDLQALRLGVGSQEIKNKLPENYSFNDIDTICENLTDYSLAVSKLPFNLKKESTKVKVTESKNTILPQSRYDDRVDEDLLKLANL